MFKSTLAISAGLFCANYCLAQNQNVPSPRIELLLLVDCAQPPIPSSAGISPRFVVETGQPISIYLSAGACTSLATTPVQVNFTAVKRNRYTGAESSAPATFASAVSVTPVFPVASAPLNEVGTVTFSTSGSEQLFCISMSQTPPSPYSVLLGSWYSCASFDVRDPVQPVPIGNYLPVVLVLLIGGVALVLGVKGLNR